MTQIQLADVIDISVFTLFMHVMQVFMPHVVWVTVHPPLKQSTMHINKFPNLALATTYRIN